MRAHGLRDLVFADDQRRQQPHHIVAGGDRDHLLVAQFVHHFGDRRHHAQADQQAFAAHFRDHRSVAILELGQPLLEQQRILAHPVEEAVRRHHVEHGVGDRHRQRIAAESRAVGAGGHALARFRRRQAGADRKAAAERLGQRHDVGRDAGVLIGEHVAGAADAGLYFVENQQQAVVVAQLAQRAQECMRHHPHAAFAHDRLDHDGGGIRANRLFGRFKIGERHLVETLDRRAEAFEIFLVPGRGNRGQRTPVECAFECDDAETLRLAGSRLIFARHLDRAFDRLGAGILEENRVGEAHRAEPVGQPLAFRDAVQVGDVPELPRLLLEALTSRGWACPRALTATPEVKSR